MPSIEEFEVVKDTAVADERGRVTLGPKAAKRTFRVSMNGKGQVLLTPVVTFSVPADEAWLYKNSTALEDLRQGLDDSANNRVVDLGSFAKYADPEIDD